MTKEEKKLAKKLVKKRIKKQKPFAHHLLSIRILDYCPILDQENTNSTCSTISYSIYFKPLLYPFLVLILTPVIFVCCAFNEQHSFQEVWCDLFLFSRNSYTKIFDTTK